jgi:hypothetical protein
MIVNQMFGEAAMVTPLRHAADQELTRRLARSAAYAPRPAHDLEAWLALRQHHNPFRVDRVPFARLDGWAFAPESGDLIHRTGRFFSVEGMRVHTDHGPVPRWSQPIIHQPDRAILGILTREIDGVMHFLMQAKMEPGNVNGVQFSPTVQATPSNYLRAHRGSQSRYVDYFTEPGRGDVLVDTLQSEQGSWFRGKRNRNLVLEVTADVEPHDDFIWLTLGEIFSLLHRPHLINMDARTVLSCLPWPASFAGNPRQRFGAVHSWLTGHKTRHTLDTQRIPLREVPGWHRDENEISHESGRYFTVVGVDVSASNREVASWSQPLLQPRGTGLVAFLVRRIDGVPHLLAHADLRPGYRDIVELGPTVQCTPANFEGPAATHRPRYLDLVRGDGVTVLFDVALSEEGGRFRDAVTRHLVVEAGEEFPVEQPPDYTWLTVEQLTGMVAFSYHVNIEARSLLLCLQAIRSTFPPAHRQESP